MIAQPFQKSTAVKQEQPAISIILPFRPMMSSKAALENKLKGAVDQVESILLADYPTDIALPVIVKLRLLLHKVNYHTHKRSVAIFVSQGFEKVYHLDIEVEENIIVDRQIHISSIVDSKKQHVEYLVLLLSAQRSQIFLAGEAGFKLIKSNGAVNTFAQLKDMTARIRSCATARQRKEILLDSFLRQMDAELSVLLDAYDLPVFVMAPGHVLTHFRQISGNTEKLVGFIEGNYDNAVQEEIKNRIMPYIANWKKFRQQNALQEIEKAVTDHKIATGMDNVKKQASHTKNKLLVLEKDLISTAFLHPGMDKDGDDLSFSKEAHNSNRTIDDIILKVLENGGDVEFVDNGILKNYNRITLVQRD